MLNQVIRFSIRNKLIVVLLTLALVAWGAYSVTQLPIDAVPDITNNQVQILTVAPSQAAQDIERLVTFPVEQSVATIPDLQEVRSFSRFGLSVVTVVFKENVDIYWARQQISERLTTAKELIPSGIGTPTLAPVSSGLGEIYQYTVHAKPGYENRYDAMELRSIQDWIVRRQLLGVEGVADVSSFGGKLKQYEIALNPDKLKAMGISIAEVFTALQKNNQNTGGAYIDKKPSAYYIRSEGLISGMDDIAAIVVKNMPSSLPVLIRDIGTVQAGSAIRYGAMTYNAEGEVVGAVVMMLKGANSSQVIGNVKERIAQIQETMPEGVVIEPFLDRTKLVNNAIHTVSRNLAEGALIVIFILVLFLGNLRAGLIVASVIPLSMLFAVSLMNVFGVSGNLMSLGALDFGLIVDGAVIIVEATLHHLGLRSIQRRLSGAEMDEEVYESSSRILNAAAFGELIIFIVYLPVLALVGIEGKMFRPMAQTVSFAILGAFILSLTYVPVMSALFLNTVKTSRLSARIITGLQRAYRPLLEGALKRKGWVVGFAALAFMLSLLLFTRLGAEFIPTLDEGDFAVETRLLTGSSMSETVDAATKAADLLLKNYPDEVKEVVGKIGSSEIPTDPMPIEACDLIVTLQPRDAWTKAHSRDELAEQMTQTLRAIPGVTFGFQQPIQMRFNELMSGARQDVVVKIYGEDLEMLTAYAAKVAGIISKVDGAKDLYVEKMTGLPQIVVNYRRDQLARFGLDIETVNQTIHAAFAGESAGMVFEGEKRFDLVVRLEQASREDIEHVRNLYINTASGIQVPLQQVADVSFVVGPNQIQRDGTHRRIMIGFNVRRRDVESIVEEIRLRVGEKIKLAPGYSLSFGGTFKNLEEATKRLSVAVPVALLLILLLLYFAFGSLGQGLLVFSAIPLSAIGGVIALWLRGMPFSISAGVGFIALFGVAVLNGVVLIGEFNRLKKEGMKSIKEIVLAGTQTRLRPVIMTAAVASLGFLPMALSHGSGAEVQKPLATVVIGGLLSATLLTLVVLPCLYTWVQARKDKQSNKIIVSIVLLCMALGLGQGSAAQTISLRLDSAMQIALANNKSLQASSLQTRSFAYQKRTASELPKTDINLLYGQYNGFYRQDNNITITQGIPFPTLIAAKSRLGDAKLKGAEFHMAATRNELVFRVKSTYYQLLHLQLIAGMLYQQDTIYAQFLKAATLRHRAGESTLLEKTLAEARKQEIENRVRNNASEIAVQQSQLQFLLGTAGVYVADTTSPQEPPLAAGTDSVAWQRNPYLAYLRQQVSIADREKSVAVNSALPDLRVGYFNQTLYGVPLNDAGTRVAAASDRFQGFQVGIAVPLWFGPEVARAKYYKAQAEAAELTYQSQELGLQSQYRQAVQDYIRSSNSLAYYRNTALSNADLISRQSQSAYSKGEISYAEYLLNQQQAIGIREGYLRTLNEYNQAVVNIEFYTANEN